MDQGIILKTPIKVTYLLNFIIFLYCKHCHLMNSTVILNLQHCQFCAPVLAAIFGMSKRCISEVSVVELSANNFAMCYVYLPSPERIKKETKRKE
jgi:hypothetical protein